MSTATTASPSAPARAARKNHRLTFGGILKSEFLKFRTLVSSWVLLGITAVLMVGLAALGAWGNMSILQNQKDNPPKEIAANPQLLHEWTDQQVQAMKTTVLGVPGYGMALAVLILVALAAVVGAGEFSNKSIVSTFTAAPRRASVYLAKTVVVSVWAAVVALVSALLAWAVAQPILAGQDMAYNPFQKESLLVLLAVVLVSVLTTWMGIGFGGLLRNNAAAIVLAVGLFFVLPILLLIFSSFWDWVDSAQNYLPWSLVQVVTSPQNGGDMGRKEALGWFLVWCVVPLVAGFFSFTRRDPK